VLVALTLASTLATLPALSAPTEAARVICPYGEIVWCDAQGRCLVCR
jgi:hypothetical protein